AEFQVTEVRNPDVVVAVGEYTPRTTNLSLVVLTDRSAVGLKRVDVAVAAGRDPHVALRVERDSLRRLPARLLRQRGEVPRAGVELEQQQIALVLVRVDDPGFVLRCDGEAERHEVQVFRVVDNGIVNAARAGRDVRVDRDGVALPAGEPDVVLAVDDRPLHAINPLLISACLRRGSPVRRDRNRSGRELRSASHRPRINLSPSEVAEPDVLLTVERDSVTSAEKTAAGERRNPDAVLHCRTSVHAEDDAILRGVSAPLIHVVRDPHAALAVERETARAAEYVGVVAGVV